MAQAERILEAVACGAIAFLRNGHGFDDLTNLFLERLGKAAEVDRAYVFRNARGRDGVLRFSQTNEWVKFGIRPQIANPDLQNVPYLPDLKEVHDSLAARQPWCAADVGALSEAGRRLLEPQGITALCLFPIFVFGSFWGYLGFDETTRSREWSTAEVNALMASAAIIGAAVEKYNHVEELKGPIETLEDVMNQLQDVMSVHMEDLRAVQKEIQALRDRR